MEIPADRPTQVVQASAAATFFALGPDRGSEALIGWRWLHELASGYRLLSAVVPPEVAEHLAPAALPGNVVLVPTETARPAAPSRLDVYDYYLNYARWLDQANKVMRDLDPDVGHQLVFGSPFWGSTLDGLSGVKVLGPVGYSRLPPPWAMRSFGMRGGVQEISRSFLATVRAPVVRPFEAIDAADVVLCVDSRTAALANGRQRPWLPFMQDGCDPRSWGETEPPSERANLLWVGRMMPRKGLVEAIEAFKVAVPRLPHATRLVLAGDGPDRQRAETAVRDWGLSARIDFLGRVPNGRVVELLSSARALVFSSLRDTFGGVCLESASVGTPVVAVDHPGTRGLHDWMPKSAMWSQRARSRQRFIRGLADGMVQAATSSEESWVTKGREAWEFSERNSWQNRGAAMLGIVGRHLQAAN